MDAISILALSIEHPLLRAVDLFFDSAIVYIAIILTLIVISEKRNDKRRKIVLSLVVAFLIATTVKVMLAHERPCIGQLECPNDYSFPSLHATIAFTLMCGFLNKKSFSFFMFFALLIAFTRLNLGVHVFQDIAGALPVALISYYITDVFWKKIKRDKRGT
ncbi:MAG: phosphatase PAP2 family protein [Candidatus Micrarchaeota archaeon]